MRDAIALGALLVLLNVGIAGQNTGPFVSNVAPDFALQDSSGKVMSLAELQKGHSVVVLHFWGTY